MELPHQATPEDRLTPLFIYSALTEEPFKECVASDLEMCRNVSKDGRKGSNTEWGMLRDRQVMLAMLLRGQAKMTAGWRVME